MEKEELSSLEKLDRDVMELNDALYKLQEHGEISEVLVGALTAQVRMLYRSVIARVCGIEESEVEDEYIDIAMEKLPTGGYDPETGIIWDGVRSMTDEELRARLNPLIEENRRNRKVADEILETVRAFNDRGVAPEKPRGVMETLHTAINKMVDRYENEDLSDEEKRQIEVEADTLARNTIASLMGIDAEELPMAMVNYIMMGKRVEVMENGNMMMEYVPYTDEEVEAMVEMVPSFEKDMEDILREYEEGMAPAPVTDEVFIKM